MKRSLLFAPILFTLAACATKGELNLAQQDIDEIKSRLALAEKSISSTRQEAMEASEKGSRETLKSLDNLRRGSADMQANLDAMRIDLQVVAGKVDDLGSATKKPLDDITLLKDDTAKGIKSIEERLSKLEQGLQETNSRVATLAKTVESPPTADSFYKQGMESFKAGDLKKSRETFSRLIEQFPEHKLAANARYWIGETYYTEKNFEQAVLEYQRVIQEYAGKEKVPAAMLKQAMAFRELGDAKSARFVLKELLEKAPNSDEAPLAKDLLTKIK